MSADGRRTLLSSNVCLLPMVDDTARTWLRLHRHYRNGYLYGDGGIMDQPHKYLEAMELIDAQAASSK